MTVVYFASLLLQICFTQSNVSAQEANVQQPAPIIYYDMTALQGQDMNTPANRTKLWDETHIVAALQGLANRNEPRLFIRYIPEPDDFWWAEMTREGGWMAGAPVEQISDLPALLTRLRSFYNGLVVYDERVPATSNLASTIAGCDNLLPVRYDTSAGSLYQQLTTGPNALPVVVSLLAPNGSPMFTGAGVIPDTTLPSTGSTKNDAYRWLIEKYVKTGKAHPARLGYYLDAFWLKCWFVGGPNLHTLTNQDYVISRGGILFDLNVWDDEATVDDPTQIPGTDVATLQELLHACYAQLGGESTIHVAGFVPWAYKYTNWEGAGWKTGGTHDPVPTEWRYAEILSCFDAYMDADAIGLSAMANASFYQHYPLEDVYPNQPEPTKDLLIARGILDETGKIIPRRYIAHYVGDYDAAAWLYGQLPRMWNDPARGTTVLNWAFNPNLAERFPLGMAWAREHATETDYFIAGDSGAGYLNPGWLSEPRRFSGLPSGMDTWERHCKRFYDQWDLKVTGFVIDGFAPGLSEEGMDAYARFSSGGICAQKVAPLGVHEGMPYIRMSGDLPHDPKQAAYAITSSFNGPAPQFMVWRSILQTPTWYANVERELKATAGEEAQVIDMATLLWLIKEYQENPQLQAPERYLLSQADAVTATPGIRNGIWQVPQADGPLNVAEIAGQKTWKIAANTPIQYLYFAVDDMFRTPEGPAMEIEVEYLDTGEGAFGLHYDGLKNTYQNHYEDVVRTNSGQWRTFTWQLDDARFTNLQNGGSDWRLYNFGDDLYISSVTVRKVR